MTIQTEYGVVEYEAKDLFIFADGIFGFPQLTKYLLLCLNEGDDSMLLMLSTEDSKVEFALINPFLLCPEYSPSLSPEELACLEAKDNSELSYYSICVVKENYLENTVNLKCPLVINPQTRRGIQVILENSPYGHRHKLRSFPAIVNSTNGDESSC